MQVISLIYPSVMYKYSSTKITQNGFWEHTQIALKAIFFWGCGVYILMIMWGPTRRVGWCGWCVNILEM